MSVSEKLIQLNTIRENIRTELNKKGVPSAMSHNFADFADDIKDVGDSLKNAYANINVIYPSGSVCTCTDGTTTLTAGNTYGAVTFGVPNSGTWTVSCTDGTYTATSSSVITMENQCESIELAYRFYLFKEGSNLQNGFSLSQTSNSSFAYTITDDKITTSKSHNVGNQLWFTPTIDISKYSTLKIECKGISRYNDSYTVTMGVGANVPSGESTSGSFSASESGWYSTSRGIVSIDVSNITSGNLYVKFCGFAVVAEIYNVWFE